MPDDRLEAYDTLVQLARRKTGNIPPELLASHVVDIYREADWSVLRAAMEAMLRRVDTARNDELRVASHPAGGSPFGSYRTRRRRAAARTSLPNGAPVPGAPPGQLRLSRFPA